VTIIKTPPLGEKKKNEQPNEQTNRKHKHGLEIRPTGDDTTGRKFLKL
jgi:hypothetical protein